jgi:hypothetical protein
MNQLQKLNEAMWRPHGTACLKPLSDEEVWAPFNSVRKLFFGANLPPDFDSMRLKAMNETRAIPPKNHRYLYIVL